MATSVWETARADTIDRIEAIAPAYDSLQQFRCVRAPRAKGKGGRDREFVARAWKPHGDVAVFGANEQQLSRVLDVEVWYSDATSFGDRQAVDERQIEEALAPRSTYPTGLMVRRLMRDEIDQSLDEERSAIRVVYPVLCIYRESVTLA